MNQGKYVFSQVVSFLPARVFDGCVAKHHGNKWIKHFSCWNQFQCMMFGQLSGRESLRDLLTCFNAHSSKFYHLGLGHNVSRTNLRNANDKRDWRIYQEFAMELIIKARSCCLPDSEFKLDLDGNVYAFDSTTIDLCLNVFWWATFRKTKSAIKLHTLYDIRTKIPAFVHVTPASVHDVNALDELNFEAGAYYVLDRGYLDFRRLHGIHDCKAFFVTRAKKNMRFQRVASAKPNPALGIISDQSIRLVGFYSVQRYPDTIRRIRFFDPVKKKKLIFLTNNFDLPAEQIALLYKYRWSVELFFKWIKQHLKIQSFWGTTENAVRTQVYIAIATYTIIAIIKSQLKSTRSTYEILQILSISLTDKTILPELFALKHLEEVEDKMQFSLQFAGNS
jgi:hypothetical protein